MEFPSSVKAWAKIGIPVALGAIGGYAYYYYIGCVSGTCPITSNPWISTVYGAVIGFFAAPRSKKTEQPPSSPQSSGNGTTGSV